MKTAENTFRGVPEDPRGPRLALKALGEQAWHARLGILTVLSVLLALAVYVFFVSAGTWTSWAAPSRNYDNLAVAFHAGRLDLNIQPPAQLLALTDPYDPSRKSIPAVGAFVKNHWDLSLYNGKFYAYWGPAPAVFLALLKFISRAHIPDAFLAFGFISGLLIVMVLLVLKMHRSLGQDIPASLTLLCILVAAFVTPMPWMLNRARIYEAAISAGQFFLMGGLLFAYIALECEKTSAFGLLLAGTSWGLAVGSRMTTLLSVGVLAGITLLFAVKQVPRASRLLDGIRYAASLGAPLAVVLLALGWYNWARFDSVFETGLRYQLTDTNMRLFYSQLFSPRYMIPNALFYLLDPVAIQSRFPFLTPDVMHVPAALHIDQLRIYHVQNSVGVLVAVPFALFAFIPVAGIASQTWKRTTKYEPALDGESKEMLAWLTWSLLGVVVISGAALLAFFYVAIRYLVELMPSLVLLSTLGVWQGYRSARRTLGSRMLFVSVVVLLALITIGVGILLAFAEDGGTILRFNPQLMRQLVHFFGK